MVRFMNFKPFDVFKGKNVLITGHTGFKGSWLSIWLTELGANVIGYALDPINEQDNFVISNLTGKIVDFRAEVRNFSKMQEVFAKYSPEFVFHLAAQSIVKQSYNNPKETYDINLGGTVNVLENCRLTKSVKIIINVTSDKCYENKEWIWGYRESDPMGGYDPYSSSKGCSELITSTYRNSFFNPENYSTHGKALSSVRAGNVIGGGDWAKDRIIPDCIRSLEQNRPINIRNPHSTRPWQFVLEPLGGYLLLAAKMYENPRKYASAWNFGPEKSSIVSVNDLANIVINKYGEGSLCCSKVDDQFHEATLLSLDIQKARFILGWKPLLDINETVEYTIDWYRNYKKTPDMYNLCRKQIMNYMVNANKWIS